MPEKRAKNRMFTIFFQNVHKSSFIYFSSNFHQTSYPQLIHIEFSFFSTKKKHCEYLSILPYLSLFFVHNYVLLVIDKYIITHNYTHFFIHIFYPQNTHKKKMWTIVENSSFLPIYSAFPYMCLWEI